MPIKESVDEMKSMTLNDSWKKLSLNKLTSPLGHQQTGQNKEQPHVCP
jgi:hypothetical protein